MADRASVQSIEALEALWEAFGRLREDAGAVLTAATREVRRQQESLAEHRAAAQAKVRRLEAQIGEMEAGTGDDSGAGGGLVNAQREREQAEDGMREVLRYARLFEEAADDYTRHARRFNGLLEESVPRATELLRRSADTLREYLATSPPAAPSAASSGGGSGSDATRLQPSPWEDRGILDVPLASIGMDDCPVNGVADFRKVTYDEMARGIRALVEVVRPAVDDGADADHFSRLDAERGLTYAEGYRRVYDAFYGLEPIHLNRVGDSYVVVNGYHRLFVARQLGVASLPCRVVARAREGEAPRSPTAASGGGPP